MRRVFDTLAQITRIVLRLVRSKLTNQTQTVIAPSAIRLHSETEELSVRRSFYIRVVSTSVSLFGPKITSAISSVSSWHVSTRTVQRRYNSDIHEKRGSSVNTINARADQIHPSHVRSVSPYVSSVQTTLYITLRDLTPSFAEYSSPNGYYGLVTCLNTSASHTSGSVPAKSVELSMTSFACVTNRK